VPPKLSASLTNETDSRVTWTAKRMLLLGSASDKDIAGAAAIAAATPTADTAQHPKARFIVRTHEGMRFFLF
jgi:hypothetical protein